MKKRAKLNVVTFDQYDISPQATAKRHAAAASAYLELEPDLRDLGKMASLATFLVMEEAGEWADPEEYKEMVEFVVVDIQRRAEALNKKYQEPWEDDRR